MLLPSLLMQYMGIQLAAIPRPLAIMTMALPVGILVLMAITTIAFPVAIPRPMAFTTIALPAAILVVPAMQKPGPGTCPWFGL